MNTENKFATNYQEKKPEIVKKGFSSDKPSLTKQSFKNDCDVNQILKRFETTGELPEMIKREGKYGDFASPMDYQESMNTVIKAREQFDGLSAKIRKRFNNDPAQFLEFTGNQENVDEMVKLGLAVKIGEKEEKKELPQHNATNIKNIDT